MSNAELDPVAADQPTTRKRSVGRIIGISAFSALAVVVVLAVVAAGIGIWTVQRSFPTVDGEIAVTGLSDPVTVQRDALGIPTITAESTDDLFFAQGYVHAQDRFWEMDFRRHVTSGLSLRARRARFCGAWRSRISSHRALNRLACRPTG